MTVIALGTNRWQVNVKAQGPKKRHVGKKALIEAENQCSSNTARLRSSIMMLRVTPYISDHCTNRLSLGRNTKANG